MNKIKLEERGEVEIFCERIINELYEIKMHICNERYFEGGVGLGGLISSLINRQFQEEDNRKKEESNKEFEKVDENDDIKDNFYTDYINEKQLRDKAEKKLEEVSKFYKDQEKKTKTFEATKNAIFDLQDLILNLIKFKKIDSTEIPNIICVLEKTGVNIRDIRLICNMKEILIKSEKFDGMAETDKI